MGLLPQYKANRQNETAQPARKVGACWWENKTFHASQSHKTIARCLASHKPKAFIKFAGLELANHQETSEPKPSLIYMVRSRPYTGNWGINMYLQDLGTQSLLPSWLQPQDTSPILSRSCPLPGLSISTEEKSSCISWKLCHTPGRSLILTGKGLGVPGKASAQQSSTAWVSTRCTHCWLRPPTPLNHRLGRQQQWYSGNPCCWDSVRKT